MLRRGFRRIRYGRPLIIVSGLPRSGTSMMMKMLEAGGVPVWLDGIRAADEQNPRGYYELERVKDLDKGQDKGWVREGRGRAVKVISSLLTHLPRTNNYNIVFMRRDLDEVLASQKKMLADRGEQGGDASDDILRKHFESHLMRVKYFLTHQPGVRALDVQYADVVSNPEPIARRIDAFLGGALDIKAMTAIADAQLYRNRAGKGATPSVSLSGPPMGGPHRT
jgi:hypothetical protein